MNIQWIERILLRDLESVKAELAAFPDEASVWLTPQGITNSAGTLALHLAGNIRHFVGAKLGGTGYVRQREHEFSARGVPRADLFADLEQAIAVVREAFGGGRAIDLDAPFPETVGGKFQVVTGDWLLQLTTHLGFHLGQIGYLRRIVTTGPSLPGPMAISGLATAVKVADS